MTSSSMRDCGTKRTRCMHYLLTLLLIFIVPLISASQYDQMVNLFNPNGDLLQVEYAERASNKGNPLICFTHDISRVNSSSNSTESGILLLCRSQPFDQLLDRQSIDKVEKVDDDIWTAFCGLAGDGRSLIRVSRSFSSNFRRLFGHAPPVVALAKHVGDTQHEATLKGDRRPLGVQLVYMGFDGAKPVLYSTGPSGLVSQWKAIAIGDKSDVLMRKLEENHSIFKKGSLSQGAESIFEALQSIKLLSDDDRNHDDDGDDEKDKDDVKVMREKETNKRNNNNNKSSSSFSSINKKDDSNAIDTFKPCDVYWLRKVKIPISTTTTNSNNNSNNNNNHPSRVMMSSQKSITSLSELYSFLSKHT